MTYFVPGFELTVRGQLLQPVVLLLGAVLDDSTYRSGDRSPVAMSDDYYHLLEEMKG